MPLLSASGIAIERGDRRLLADINLTVSAGEIWQLVGANGVGKTSLMRALAGLARLGVEGHIERQAGLLYLGHASALKPSLNALENLRCHPACDVVATKGELMKALAKVGLAGSEVRPIGALSAGQQRRVALAHLLLSQSRLWLLDEPFTALDTSGCSWLDAQIYEHVGAGGGVIFTSHQPSRFGSRQQDLELARFVC